MSNSNSSSAVVLVSASMYTSLSDPRFSFAIQTCRQAGTSKLPLVICDDSSDPTIISQLNVLGNGFVTAFKMPGPGKKGAAIRYAVAKAMEKFPDCKALAFFEMEKVRALLMLLLLLFLYY